MKVFLCLDNKNGRLFNNRRQSRDRLLIDDLVCTVGKNRLFINSFSAPLFENSVGPVFIDDNFMKIAGEDDFCFVENIPLSPYIQEITMIIVYRWNREYPADFLLDIDLTAGKYTLVSSEDFAGFSHDKITKETYKNE